MHFNRENCCDETNIKERKVNRYENDIPAEESLQKKSTWLP